MDFAVTSVPTWHHSGECGRVIGKGHGQKTGMVLNIGCGKTISRDTRDLAQREISAAAGWRLSVRNVGPESPSDLPRSD